MRVAGVLVVEIPAPVREHRRPVDTFFMSLAEQEGENAVCIILSGTDSDGTLGLTAIKEHGGLTFAQVHRIHWRLQLLRLDQFPDYISHITKNPVEFDFLFLELSEFKMSWFERDGPPRISLGSFHARQ